jgi:hypothetical protein
MSRTNAEKTVVAAVNFYSWYDLEDVHGCQNAPLLRQRCQEKRPPTFTMQHGLYTQFPLRGLRLL